MRAMTITAFGGPEVLSETELPDPRPGPGEVAIEVAYAGVNYVELMCRRGVIPAELPAVPGIEVAGVVTELGPGVAELEPGRPVAALSWLPGSRHGGYATRVVVDARLTVPLDGAAAAIAPEQAAALPCAAVTAYQLLADVARLRPGETVLVHAAAGGVGSLAVQLARRLGAGRVFGTVGSPDKAAFARRLGCEEVFARDGFVEAVRAATGGKGADVILDAIGGENALRSVAAAATFGRVAYYGNSSWGDSATVGLADLWFGGKGVVGYSIGHVAREAPETWNRAAHEVLALMAEGAVRVAVTDVLPLAQAAAAHRALESGTTTGKLLLRVG